MKKIFLFAAAAALFAACSNSDELATAQAPEAVQGEIPVGFDGYTSRALTRAGKAGADTDLTILRKSDSEGGGFGVFGYYTDNNTYDGLTTPNFMYNQGVFWNIDAFKYEPLKYWPNEYGTTAVSDDVDKVSFFAYAPYVAVTPATGKVTGDATSGIVGLSRNSAAGDPIVKYIADLDPAKAVDLCWGVVGSSEGTWFAIDGDQTMTVGKPWLDVHRAKTATSQKMKFTFKHALAKLNVQVDAAVDATTAGTGVDEKTKIYIRSITFSGFALKGALNLNNTAADTPLWLGFAGTNDLEAGEEVTIYDGLKDGKEGVAKATNEKVTGLNDQLRQLTEWGASGESSGVTASALNLFNHTTATQPVYVIPTGETIKVTIVYDVETADSNLATYLSDGKTPGSSIENRITQNITFGSGEDKDKFVAGKAYTLKLHLGLTSVKFDADVTNWVPADEGSADLPANK